MKNLQKLGFQMELLLSNIELSVILMILPDDHQHILQPQRMFENLAKLYAKRVRMYTRAKHVPDNPVKNALTPGTIWSKLGKNCAERIRKRSIPRVCR